MKDEEAQTTTLTAASTTTNASANKKEGSSEGGFLGRGKYKFWALAAILLLAFWSMFTGSVTLKWSSVHLNHVSDDLLDSPLHQDLDILEVEEREKTVRHMWDVYTQSRSVKLPIFWQEAFEAAYEDLINEVSSIRDAAISEIAKMSLVRSTLKHQLEPPAHKSMLRSILYSDGELELKELSMSLDLSGYFCCVWYHCAGKHDSYSDNWLFDAKDERNSCNDCCNYQCFFVKDEEC